MKTVIITGASRGIGLAAAKKFIDNGWQVIGTYNRTMIPIESENLFPVPLDLASQQSIAQSIEDIKSITKTIDVLVNNAGIILDAHDEQINLDKIRKTFEVDLFATIEFTEKILPLIRQGSHIVNIDSLYGGFSFPIDDKTAVGYRLAKAALNMYTRILAFRLKDKDIAVSSLDPGWVKTDMGMQAASKTEGPDREPEQAAEDIYQLATAVKESGYFWRFGKQREW